MNDVIVRMEHLRLANLCSRGARMWFSRMGLDYGLFLREGYPASTLEATNDALALRVCQVAREEEES
jgi:hypothetical protein